MSNYLLDPDHFNTANWSHGSFVTVVDDSYDGPDGPLTASTLTDTNAGSVAFRGQVTTVPATVTSKVASVWFPKTVGGGVNGFPALDVEWGATVVLMCCNTDDGTVAFRAGGSYITPAGYGAIDRGDWWQFYLTNPNDSSTAWSFYIAPSYNHDGSGTPDLTCVGTIHACRAELKDGTTPSVPPTSDFTVTPATGVEPLPVDCADISLGDPTSWLWDFGDGETSTDQNPTHVYASAGSYDITLTATNALGSDSVTHTAAVVVSTAAVDTLRTGYNVDLVPCLAQAFQRLYMANGFDAMQVTDDGLSIRQAGIAAPTVDPTFTPTAGGSMNEGDHLIRYRYQDQLRGRLSDPSDAITGTITDPNLTAHIGVTASTDPYVTHIIIEVTPVGAETYYRAAIVVNATGNNDVTMADDSLIQQVPASRDGEFQHQHPPLASIVVEHRQRLWTWGLEPRDFTGCTVTNGSPTVTAGADPFSDQWAGLQMLGPDGAVYAIDSATSTEITLATNYAGSNDGSATITVKSGRPSLLAWSRALFPESFDPTNFAKNISLDAGDTPAGAASYFSDLYLMGKRSMRRLVFTGDPATGMLLSVPGTMGVFHQRCVCSAGPGLMFGWGRDGAWKVDAMQPQKISARVEQTLAALANTSRINERFVCYEPVQRVALFFFCLLGEGTCRAALAYHIETGKWEIWRYRQGITAACANSAYADRQRLMLADENDFSWRVGVSVNDGGGENVMTVTAGATTTVIPGTNSAVVGQIAYRPETGEERVITSASPAQIVCEAFGTIPANGETIHIGSIRQRILTDWFVGDGLSGKNRPQWLQILIRANRTAGQTMGVAEVRFYRDFNRSSAIAVSSMTDDEWPAGVQPIDGGTVTLIDLDAGGVDGFIPVPVPDGWARAICAEIVHEYASSPVRFYDVRFAADDRYASATVDNE